MAILGSAFGRALAGAGAATADIANKYIDQNLLLQRQQALADLQRQTAKNIREDDDAFANDPTRVARNRENKVADITATGTATNDVALAGERGRATDATLQGALRENEVGKASAMELARQKVASDTAKANGNDPLYLKGVRNMAQAQHIESSASVAQAALAREQLKQTQYVSSLKTEIQKAVATGDKAGEESLRDQLGVWQEKASSSEKYAAILERTSNNNAAAMKVLNDPMATEDAKQTAKDEIARNNGIAEQIAKKAGITIAKPEKSYDTPTPETLAKMKANLSNPAAVEEFKRRFGPTALAQLQSQADAGQGRGAVNRPPAVAAAPTEPGFFGKVIQRVGDLGTDYQSPAGKQALRNRMAEAQNGGPPLTDVEKMRMQQAGF